MEEERRKHWGDKIAEMESHNAKDLEHIEITEEILKPYRLEPADRVVTLQHIETLAEIMNSQ